VVPPVFTKVAVGAMRTYCLKTYLTVHQNVTNRKNTLKAKILFVLGEYEKYSPKGSKPPI